MYTDRRKRPHGAVLGHLCTLSQRGTLASGRWGRNSVHRSPKTASRSRSGAFVYTVAARGSRGRPVVTQGDTIVYTDRRKRSLGAVLGHLCTLLRRGGHAGGRWGRNSVHRLAKVAFRRRFGAFVYTVALRAASRVALQAAPRAVTRAASDGTSASTPWCANGAPSVVVSALVEKTGSLRPTASGLLVLVHERAKHALGLSQLPTERFGALGDGPRDLGIHLLGNL